MADPVIVNNPSGESKSGGLNFLLGIIFLLVFVFLFIYYVLPLLRQNTSSPQINVPEQVDVNVNQGGQGQ